MNQFNNDSLRFQDKIILIEVPETELPIEEIFDIVINSLKCLYGIAILIFGKHTYQIKLNSMVTAKTVETANRFLDPELAYEHLEIIPFPNL